MEAEERPSKLRKLDHDHETARADPVASNNQLVEQPSTLSPPSEFDERQQDDAIGPDPPSEQHLSKNQLKKLSRRQQWEANREARKIWRKEKQMAKKARKREAIHGNETAPPEVQPSLAVTDNGVAAGHEEPQLPLPQPKPAKRVKPTQLPLTIILDCSFDELMTDKERVSLGSQLTRSYSDNRNAPYRAHMIVSSFSGGLKERFETVLGNHHRGWKGVKFTEEDFLSAAREAQNRMLSQHDNNSHETLTCALQTNSSKQGEIIYLTSDSPDTLTELKAYNTYVVGALVDRNRHKGICYKRAMDRNVKTAKLPIGEYMQMASRFVLTTNQVVEIMLRWLDCGDWAQAFLKVMPKRKGGVLKTKAEEDGKVEGGG